MGIVVFAILAVIAYVAYQLGKYDPQIRGAKGERRVADILRRLPEDEYKVLNNLLVQSRFGTTQIDHVVVSVHGIFERTIRDGLWAVNMESNGQKICMDISIPSETR